MPPDSPGAGAPDYRFPVTPAMIEAGVNALFEFDPRFESEEEAVAAIFSAMLIAEPSVFARLSRR